MKGGKKTAQALQPEDRLSIHLMASFDVDEQ